GYLNSNAMQDPFAMELARRGFVVFSMDMYGHGNSELANNREEPTGTVTGGIDAYRYMLTVPYVDHTRIGFAGHSMGGMNTGNAIALEAGFYTLADTLLIMLHDELGASISAQDVAAQDPDSVAARLGPFEQGVYKVRKAEITEAYHKNPVAEVFLGSGPGFAFLSDAHEVEVAGIKVWRDLQANVGVAIGIYEENAWLMFGSRPDGINASARIKETTMARRLFGTGSETVKDGVWYGLNLSPGSAQARSAELGGLYDGDYQNRQLRQAVAARAARAIVQPRETHMMNHFSRPTVSFVVEFFTTVMNYNNGELAQGATPIPAQKNVWLFKEYANGVSLAGLFLFIYAFGMLLLKTPFFGTLKKAPPAPGLSRKDPLFWIMAALLVIIPAVTYIPFFLLGGSPGTAAGNKGPIPYSFITSQEKATRVACWAVLNGVIAFVLISLRHLLKDRKDGIALAERFGLRTSIRDFGKSLLLAFSVFASAQLLVAFSNYFFNYSDMRMWVIAFRQMNQSHLASWAGYLIFFFVFYLANSMVINSSRMKDMSDGKNLAILAVMNGVGIFLFLVFNYVYMVIRGNLVYYDFGADQFLAVAVVFPMVVVLPLAAVYGRKFYNQTGNVYLGALINTMIFTWAVVGNTSFHYSLIFHV
ncbi:MAG: prolyl oligopeptidase family serine peptidase, partial [Treponema sp.]|nr:prolyl oligopeptidase family serine peptidase [Treponema sp.]